MDALTPTNRRGLNAVVLELPSLLITDDDRYFRETLRGVFEPRGFRTTLAADGCEALEIVRQSDFHLLLVDMHMPRMNGLEMVRRLREMPSKMPCIRGN
jgi:CheY-like chemotaxis protein